MQPSLRSTITQLWHLDRHVLRPVQSDQEYEDHKESSTRLGKFHEHIAARLHGGWLAMDGRNSVSLVDYAKPEQRMEAEAIQAIMDSQLTCPDIVDLDTRTFREIKSVNSSQHLNISDTQRVCYRDLLEQLPSWRAELILYRHTVPNTKKRKYSKDELFDTAAIADRAAMILDWNIIEVIAAQAPMLGWGKKYDTTTYAPVTTINSRVLSELIRHPLELLAHGGPEGEYTMTEFQSPWLHVLKKDVKPFPITRITYSATTPF